MRCHLCRYILKVEPKRFSGGIYVGHESKRLCQDFYPEANWKYGRLPLIAMGKTGWSRFGVKS